MTAPSVVSARTPAFDAALPSIAQAVQAGTGMCLLFEDASEEARQQALGRLKEATKLSLHQVSLDTLFDERPMAVQGNLRETFDAAGEAPSILCFDHADAFFRKDDRQGEADDRDHDALTPITYLFDRIEAFTGVVVLCMKSPAYIEEARPNADVVVTF